MSLSKLELSCQFFSMHAVLSALYQKKTIADSEADVDMCHLGKLSCVNKVDDVTDERHHLSGILCTNPGVRQVR